jgi:hypothetical protein
MNASEFDLKFDEGDAITADLDLAQVQRPGLAPGIPRPPPPPPPCAGLTTRHFERSREGQAEMGAECDEV